MIDFSLRKESAALILLNLAAMASLAGCSSTDDPQPNLGPAPLPATQLGLPAPAELGRLAAPPREVAFAPEDLVRDGANFEDGLPANRVQRVDDSAVMNPAAAQASSLEDFSFAIWRFTVSDYDGADVLRLHWDAEPQQEGSAWVAVGDYTKDAWAWSMWIPGEPTDISNVDYLSGSDSLVVAILLMGDESATLRRLRLGEVLLSGELTADPGTIEGDSTVMFDASSLVPNGGAITNYEWDLNGDGTFELDTDDTSTSQRDYVAPLSITAAVRLTTDEGLRATAQTSIHLLSGAWERVPLAVPPTESLIEYRAPRIGMVNGRPVVAYQSVPDPDSEAGTIDCIVATNTLAEDWNAPFTAVAAEWAPRRFDAPLGIGGRAVLACGSLTTAYFVRAGNDASTAFAAPTPVSANLASPRVCLSIYDSRPVIGYSYDNPETEAQPEMFLAFGNDPAGSGFATKVRVAGFIHEAGEIGQLDGSFAATGLDALGNVTVQLSNSEPDTQPWTGQEVYFDPGEPGSYEYTDEFGRFSIVSFLGDFSILTFETTSNTGADSWHESVVWETELRCAAVCGNYLNFDGAALLSDISTQKLWLYGLNAEAEPGTHVQVAGEEEAVDTSGSLVCNNCDLLTHEGIPLLVYEDNSNHSINFAVMR